MMKLLIKQEVRMAKKFNKLHVAVFTLVTDVEQLISSGRSQSSATNAKFLRRLNYF